MPNRASGSSLDGFWFTTSLPGKCLEDLLSGFNTYKQVISYCSYGHRHCTGWPHARERIEICSVVMFYLYFMLLIFSCPQLHRHGTIVMKMQYASIFCIFRVIILFSEKTVCRVARY